MDFLMKQFAWSVYHTHQKNIFNPFPNILWHKRMTFVLFIRLKVCFGLFAHHSYEEDIFSPIWKWQFIPVENVRIFHQRKTIHIKSIECLHFIYSSQCDVILISWFGIQLKLICTDICHLCLKVNWHTFSKCQLWSDFRFSNLFPYFR